MRKLPLFILTATTAMTIMGAPMMSHAAMIRIAGIGNSECNSSQSYMINQTCGNIQACDLGSNCVENQNCNLGQNCSGNQSCETLSSCTSNEVPFLAMR